MRLQQINGFVHDTGQRWFKTAASAGAASLVALTPSPVLFICAKDLFVGAKQAENREGQKRAILRMLGASVLRANKSESCCYSACNFDPLKPTYSRNTKPRLRRWSAWLAAKRSKSSS